MTARSKQPKSGKIALRSFSAASATVKNGGVGYGKVSAKAPARSALIAKLNSWAKQISTGKVKPPRTGISNG